MSKIAKKSIISSIGVGTIYLAALILPNYFVYTVLAMFLFVILFWKYNFDVLLNVSSLKEKYKFIILPMIYNLGALYLTTIFFQTFAKAIISLVIVVSNYYLWYALRKVHNLSERAALLQRNILIVISFVSVFLGSTTIFRLYMLFSTSESSILYQSLLVFLVFCLFYLVSTFLTWENSSVDDYRKLRPYSIANSLLGAEIAWISSLWIVNYPVISAAEKANLGATPLPAILLTIVFYFLWGIIFHKIDGSLTRKVLTEYILLTFVFLMVLLLTARWLPTL